ncbi:hypothetical protein SRABI26_01903 [Arthrobacter sp. Bi26]|nr:hypothetical protein SRABI26_01903 [Arthrobacter sp. Bi26]
MSGPGEACQSPPHRNTGPPAYLAFPSDKKRQKENDDSGEDEFTCYSCFLGRHRSQLAREMNGPSYCIDREG